MSFIGGYLLRKESLDVAKVYLELHDWNLVREKVLSENLLQSKRISSAKRFVAEIISRLIMGELSDFYHRYLTGELQFPENFGKTWSKVEDDVLYDMIHYACTVRQIAAELKRHPVSVVNKLAKYLDDDSIQNRITQDFYDVPVRELIRWV